MWLRAGCPLYPAHGGGNLVPGAGTSAGEKLRTAPGGCAVVYLITAPGHSVPRQKGRPLRSPSRPPVLGAAAFFVFPAIWLLLSALLYRLHHYPDRPGIFA